MAFAVSPAAVPSVRRPLVLADLIPAIPGRLVRDAALVLGGAAFVGLFAQLSLPVAGSPVPVTGQTFAVLLGGAVLGLRRALAATVLYLLAGLAGVPWYAHHGHGYVASGFGYILGFVVAAAVVGFLAGRGGDRTVARTVGTMLLGTLLVYAVGVPWLAVSLHLPVATALREGLRPFLLGDGLKVLLAAGLLPSAWKLLRRS